jgi:hypothetical protein
MAGSEIVSGPRVNKRWKREHNKRQRTQKDDAVDVSSRFLFKDGMVMVILRPENVDRKLAGVAAIKDGTPHEIAQPAFDELLREQPHQFIGYAAKGRPDILDKYGETIDTLRPGDSFVGCNLDAKMFEPPLFMRTGISHYEVWDGLTVLVLPRPDLKLDSNTGIVVESTNPADRGSIVLRGGATKVDCHIPTLNRIWTGDANVDYRTYKQKKDTLQ